MKLFKKEKKRKEKKDFVTKAMKSARKGKDGTLATRIMNQFIPETGLRTPPPKKERHKYFGNKQMRLASEHKIGLCHKHGIVGEAIFNMKKDRILREKANS